MRAHSRIARTQEYNTSPATKWMVKDVAMYLILALTVRGETKAKGVTKLNNYINIMDFFAKQVFIEFFSFCFLQHPVNTTQHCIVLMECHTNLALGSGVPFASGHH